METLDLIDKLQQEWQAERPELDSSAMSIVGRTILLGELMRKSAHAVLADFGIGYTDLDVLATLRRSGTPYRLRPADLLKAILIQSGSLTACLDRLEGAGLIERVPTPNDRRSRSVQLTDKGIQLVDNAITTRFGEATQFINSLSSEERTSLEHLLRKLLLNQSKEEN